MDSRDFFQDVAARNYYEFFQRHDDKRLLCNAVVSMNSVAEWLALDRLGYPPKGPRTRSTKNPRTIFPFRFESLRRNIQTCAED